jgi:hypothetical protein
MEQRATAVVLVARAMARAGDVVVGIVRVVDGEVLWATSGPRKLAIGEAVERCRRRRYAVVTECVGVAA